MPPPGWYQDPQQPTRLRWWDGQTWHTKWSDEVQPKTGMPPAFRVFLGSFIGSAAASSFLMVFFGDPFESVSGLGLTGGMALLGGASIIGAIR